MTKRSYLVTLYNQHEGTSRVATGPTRKEAFRRAMARAGEDWLRVGGDKATTLRTLFAEHLMTPYYRTTRQAYVSHPSGCGVEFVRLI